MDSNVHSSAPHTSEDHCSHWGLWSLITIASSAWPSLACHDGVRNLKCIYQTIINDFRMFHYDHRGRQTIIYICKILIRYNCPSTDKSQHWHDFTLQLQLKVSSRNMSKLPGTLGDDWPGRLLTCHDSFCPRWPGLSLSRCPNVDQFVAIKESWASRIRIHRPGHSGHSTAGYHMTSVLGPRVQWCLMWAAGLVWVSMAIIAQ